MSTCCTFIASLGGGEGNVCRMTILSPWQKGGALSSSGLLSMDYTCFSSCDDSVKHNCFASLIKLHFKKPCGDIVQNSA